MQLYERDSRRHRGYMQEAEELAKSIQEGKKSREIEKNGQYYPVSYTHLMHEFYFESAAMILTLITVGKMLESRSKGKTTDALKSLMSLAPKTATIVRDGVEQEVPVAQVKKGDVFVVRPGENIPVDLSLIHILHIAKEAVRQTNRGRLPTAFFYLNFSRSCKNDT